jgi:hypothetical protein
MVTTAKEIDERIIGGTELTFKRGQLREGSHMSPGTQPKWDMSLVMLGLTIVIWLLHRHRYLSTRSDASWLYRWSLLEKRITLGLCLISCVAWLLPDAAVSWILRCAAFVWLAWIYDWIELGWLAMHLTEHGSRPEDPGRTDER